MRLITIETIGNRHFVLPNNIVITPTSPANVTVSMLEDFLDVRKAVAKGVRDGFIKAKIGSTNLSPTDIMNIDEFVSNIDEKSLITGYAIANYHNSITINFTNPYNSDYGVVVTVEDNINSWIEKISNTSFRIMFSSNYTGNVYYIIMFI